MLNRNKYTAEMRQQMFLILVLSICVSNFLACVTHLALNGMGLVLPVCGSCTLATLILYLWGQKPERLKKAMTAIMLLYAWLEFPLLFFIYRNVVSPYFALGIVGIMLFLPRKMKLGATIVAVLASVAARTLSYMYPQLTLGVDIDDLPGTALAAFVITSVALFGVLRLMLRIYDQQREEILTMAEGLSKLANQDSLTGLATRRYMMTRLTEWMSVPDGVFSLIILDIDDFKQVNDTHGHLVGDQVLVWMAECLLRETEKQGMACRYGGEEFVILLPATERSEIYQMLTRIRENLAKATAEKNLTVTFSGGVQMREFGMSVDDLLRQADRKLYQAKEQGKDQLVF